MAARVVLLQPRLELMPVTDVELTCHKSAHIDTTSKQACTEAKDREDNIGCRECLANTGGYQSHCPHAHNRVAAKSKDQAQRKATYVWQSHFHFPQAMGRGKRSLMKHNSDKYTCEQV